MMRLFFEALIKFFLGFIIVGFLLFVPANSFCYWNAWLFMGLLFIPMFIVGIVLFFKNPFLLKKRLNVNEKVGEQRKVILLSGLMFFLGFIVAGFNYRYGWFVLSNFVVFVSSILFVFAYILYAEVLRENAFLSRTVEVVSGQKVIDTGLYGIVRHPMYGASVLLFLTMPLILGSIFSFFIFLIYPFIIAKRIRIEEEILERELNGYSLYKKRVRYKVLPFVW